MNVSALVDQAQLAEEAGFAEVAKQLRAKAELGRKLALGYELYRYVSEDAINAFQTKLKATTTRAPNEQEIGLAIAHMYSVTGAIRYALVKEVCDQLVFTPMEAYASLPPTDVLEKVKEARSHGVFDRFEVAAISTVATKVVFPDPIVFGCIDGCTDRFYIAEWGTDVSINDLLGEHDG